MDKNFKVVWYFFKDFLERLLALGDPEFGFDNLNIGTLGDPEFGFDNLNIGTTKSQTTSDYKCSGHQWHSDIFSPETKN